MSDIEDDLETVAQLLADAWPMSDLGLDDVGMDTLAEAWVLLEQARANLDVLCRDLSNRVGVILADADYDPKEGYRLSSGTVISHYQPAVQERWQGRALLRNLSSEMVEPATGEVVPAVPLSVLTEILPGVGTDEQTSSKWKTTGLKNIDVNPDDYRTRQWAEPRVKLGPKR